MASYFESPLDKIDKSDQKKYLYISLDLMSEILCLFNKFFLIREGFENFPTKIFTSNF